MMTRRLACPSGRAGLKVAATLPVGKKITCPKCEDSFRIPEGQVSLAGVGSRRSLDYLREHGRDPKAHVPTSRMPGYGEDRISDKDLRALAAYLASLKQ